MRRTASTSHVCSNAVPIFGVNEESGEPCRFLLRKSWPCRAQVWCFQVISGVSAARNSFRLASGACDVITANVRAEKRFLAVMPIMSWHMRARGTSLRAVC